MTVSKEERTKAKNVVVSTCKLAVKNNADVRNSVAALLALNGFVIQAWPIASGGKVAVVLSNADGETFSVDVTAQELGLV